MKMRDQVRQTDPNRAALIEKALKESGERHVEADFQEIVDLLRRDKFGDAARKQGKVNEDLDAILKLLLNEDRSRRILTRKPSSGNISMSSTASSANRRISTAEPPAGRSKIALRRTGRAGQANGQPVEGHCARTGKGKDGGKDDKKDGKRRRHAGRQQSQAGRQQSQVR